MARSSTTSQPMAMRPVNESRMPRLSSARSSTTVLATDSASPNTSAAPGLQPHHIARPPPRSVATAICASAPGSAILRTARRSSREKWRPTPNISSMTPISASCAAMLASATKPGVNGPMITPANRYPTSAGNRSLAARKPNTSASPRPAAMVLMRETLWGIAAFCRNDVYPFISHGLLGVAALTLRSWRCCLGAGAFGARATGHRVLPSANVPRFAPPLFRCEEHPMPCAQWARCWLSADQPVL
jgi:hypothetical protein